MMPIRDTKPRFAARLLLLFACPSVSAAVVLSVAGCGSTARPQSGVQRPKVTVVLSQKRSLPLVVKPIGTTRALSDVTIRARVKGFLEEKHFDDGKNVKKGQLLLVIEERPYQVQLEAAVAQLDASKAQLERATASKVVPVSRAKLALADAQLSLDQIEERRERSLLARNAASRDDFDRAEAQRKKSAAQVESDRASLAEAEADYRIDIENAKAAVERASSAVEDAEINLGYCRMFAPIDGRIGELKVKLGNLVGDTGATELVNLQQLHPMGIDLRPAARNLPIATAIQAKGGIDVEVTVEGERPHTHVGRTIFIDNQVDTQTSTFLVRAEVPNPDGAILPGQYIKASVIVGEYVDAIVVPEQAVLEGQEGTRVYVVDAANKVESVKVNPVDDYGGLRVLESGLEAGQRVIVEGIQLVRAGQEVDVEKEAPMERFEHAAPPSFNADPRFTSKVSRLPGIANQSPDAEPAAKKAGPESKKAKPEPNNSEPESKKSTPDTKAGPDQGSSAPPEKKAR
jgi:membrane fusion protein, multidrug efflux system